MKQGVISILFSAIFCCFLVTFTNGQEVDSDDGQTRDIIPVFETARAKTNKSSKKDTKRKSTKPRVRMSFFASGGLRQSANRIRVKKEAAGKNIPTEKPKTFNPKIPLAPKKNPLTQVRFTKDEFAKAKKLGITLWKFDNRKLGNEIPGGQTADSRSITHPIDDSTVVRVNQNTVFRVGDKIRLSVESPTSGYLYVANCEVYEDGSYGTPMIVFPTKRTRGGVNFLSVGNPIELPAINDQPNYFLITESKSEKKVVAEALVFVVTKSLITDFEVPSDNTELAKNRLELWEKKWTGRTEIWEIDSKESREYTQAEYESGNEVLNVGEESKGRSLKSDEPEPHTLYAVKSPSEDGMLFTLILRYE
jgi:hypothetical protein